MLTDPARCQVLLVTLPEETPVNEVVETAVALEDKVGVDLGPVVVNGLYPVLDGLDVDPEKAAGAQQVTLFGGRGRRAAGRGRFRQRRQELQQEQVARLAEALPLPQLAPARLFAVDLGLGRRRHPGRRPGRRRGALPPPPPPATGSCGSRAVSRRCRRPRAVG